MSPRTAIYCRISDDREGRGLGVARQEEDCRRLAENLGWTVSQVYADNDISAFSGKERPDYKLMIDDIKSNRIDALICWHTDRLHRNVRELLDFLDVVNGRDKINPNNLFSIQTVKAGQIDLATSTGRAMAITFGAWAEQSSAHAAEKIRRKVEELVEAGEVHNGGPRPFGYTRIYQGEGPRRKIIRDEICEPEAEIIRECVKRALDGESLRSICKDLNARGITTSMGNPWTVQAMRGMLRSGRIAGLKEFHRKVVGPAKWPAIIEIEEHQQLRALLDRKGRKTGGDDANVRKYFLTGFVHCTCTPKKPKKMRVSKAHGKAKYSCQPRAEGGCGGRTILLAELEKFVEKWIVARANDPKVLAGIAQRQNNSGTKSKALIEAIEKGEKRLDFLQAQLANDDEDEEDLVEVVAAVRKVRVRLREDRNKLARITSATPMIGIDVKTLKDDWKGLGLDRQRAITSLYIKRILIHPTSIRGRFDPDRIEIEPR
ncbi:hypothetical protein Aph01nite_59480 [Acrocarpospora phusangensis]|uniref:Recombinase family protein n=1 Tax=Acrocarpospora phusangensis TaxID=1070424 RepID=A0A919QF68_9ACTN|nr:recombinase family protein [Acrocarpospora phusangensis]GIH27638.1 hypothetical protein Aph01nite_59480 [Acrocarpospora phusangensis]